MLGVIILEERKAQLKTRVTEKEKLRIENKAKKCGLSVSEYLRKRALGYSPKALLPETFYEFTEKLGVLCDALGAFNSTELPAEVLKLLDEIYAKLLTPGRKTSYKKSRVFLKKCKKILGGKMATQTGFGKIPSHRIEQ